MTYELTKEGLFSYFDPVEVMRIIKLPIVRRSISEYESTLCLEACDTFSNESTSVKKSIDARHAILNFEVLQYATIKEVTDYLKIPQVRALYVQCYGEYFKFFETNVLNAQHQPHAKCGELFAVIDEISERELILHMKSAMGFALIALGNILQKQDLLLQEIATHFSEQATKAQSYIAALQEKDNKYKESVINCAFSLLKLGLDVVHAGELLNIGESLSNLVAIAFDKIEVNFASFITGMQTLVVCTHGGAVAEAEKGLLATALPQDIERFWTRYRVSLFEYSNNKIGGILESCLKNDNFFRCIIREVLYQKKELTYRELLGPATKKAEKYITDILQSLQNQVAKIDHLRKAAASEEGHERIALYFRQVCLFNYAKQHEHADKKVTTGWFTRHLGRELTINFPGVVFQKKIFPIGVFHHHVTYCKRKITTEEYREMRKHADVRLGLFTNSADIEGLISSLEDRMPLLMDLLIQDLQEISFNSSLPSELVNDIGSVRKARYSFSQRRRVLFDFSDSKPKESNPVKPAENAVVLLSRRSFPVS